MPDQRKHRGPHPGDEQRFAAENVPRLREATQHLSWLLSRGYASASALKLVGDRFSLDARQRKAVARSACSNDARTRRQQHEVPIADLADGELWIDGYNVLTSVEAALSGGVILSAADGCYRDMASMHGSYRKVEETLPAVNLLGELLEAWTVAACRWLFDRPVSNSGRLKTILRETADQRGWNWQIELVPNPDRDLVQTTSIVATADSQVLDQVDRWFNLAKAAIDARVDDAWIVDLSGT